MKICTSPQTDGMIASHHSVFYRPDALPAAQPTASNHCISEIKTWTEIVLKDCQARNLNREDAMDLNRWRKQIRDD